MHLEAELPTQKEMLPHEDNPTQYKMSPQEEIKTYMLVTTGLRNLVGQTWAEECWSQLGHNWAEDFDPHPREGVWEILFKTSKKSVALSNLNPLTLDYHILNSLHQLHIDPGKRSPSCGHLAAKSRERVYYNIIRTTISTLWQIKLLHHAPLCT